MTGVPEQAAVLITGSWTSGTPVRRVEDAHGSGYAREWDQSWKSPHGDQLNVYETEEKYRTLDPDHTLVEDDIWRSVEMSHNNPEETVASSNTNPGGSDGVAGSG